MSLRDEDTRNTFASHLYNALCAKKITTYFGLVLHKAGGGGDDEITNSAPHLRAIQDSKLALIIFSENYASSARCLDELIHIFHCNDRNRQPVVVPVFYHVNPSHVRKQQGSYEAAFAAHEKHFDQDVNNDDVHNNNNNNDKVREWRSALARAANLSGWDSSAIGSESKLVEAIADDILKKLSRITSSSDYEEKGLVGTGKRIQQIVSLLQMGSSDDTSVRILGIWGACGIGKTTLARVIFNRLSSQFDSCCFLENVKEETQKHGLSHLQTKLFSELLEEKNLSMANRFWKDRLRHKRALIVVDGVDDTEQLEYLVGDRAWFGHGSRIIVTAREVEVVDNTVVVDGTYKVEELDSDEALELFYSKAFGGLPVPKNYAELSKRAIHHAEGIPLALKDLGRRLYSKSTKVWESELSRQGKRKKVI
ncbi:TMV resistance protein N-like isoform X2 [Morus notabilis]|nr:TMV resistance protein N-like isoform X2 [Morus notabilis]